MTRKKRLIFPQSILLLCIFSYISIFSSALNADNIHEATKNVGLIKGKILPCQDQKNSNVFPNSDDTAKSLLKQLDKYITEKVSAEKFSGSVLLAKDGKSFFKKAYGFASRRFWVPNKVDTKFNLGSMNKMFTTIAVAQLIEKGRLSYQDKVGKYLGKEWISPENGEKITIHHLLTHTSGLGDFFSEVYWQSSKLLFFSVNDYQILVKDMELQFQPGTKWSYSNAGFVLLGAIIEKVAEMDYFDYVRENIYKKANMINSDSYEMDKPVPNLAIGYQKRKYEDGKERWQNNLFFHESKGSPAGGGFSTVEDLLNFDIALRGGTLVSQETWKLLITERAGPSEGKKKWGYGFIIENKEKLGRIVGHGGGFFGLSSNLDMYLDSGYTVVVMSNYGDGVEVVSEEIQKVIHSLVRKSDYLGQKPPGTTPKVFAPGIVSTNKSEFNAAFSPNGKDFFFSVNESPGRETMMFMKYENNQWTSPQSAPFVSDQNDCDPFFSHDGSRLYFISTRSKKNDKLSKDWDIWYVERTDSGWSEARNLGPPVNSDHDEYYVSLTREGAIYFASNRAGGYGSFDIYRSRFVDGHYLKPENLGASINTKYLEHDPFIAPNKSYIVFTSVDRPGGFGTGDLYISFRRKEGTWTEAKNLGKTFNTSGYDFCPMVSPDGKYFFFTKKGDIYWVSMEVIKQLKLED